MGSTTIRTAPAARSVPGLREVPPLRDLAHLDRVVEDLGAALVEAAVGIDAVALALDLPGAPLECRVATDPVARELFRLQRRTGEGPGVDAVRTGRPVYVERARFAPWPTFGPVAVDHGLRVMACAPVAAGPAARGALTAYGVTHDDLDARSRRLVHDLARTVGARVAELVARDHPAPAHDVAVDDVATERDRRMLERAVGIVQERYGTSAERALALLEASGSRQHVGLGVVARHVVEQAERWGGPVPQPRTR